jgi:hypothetical protein
MADRPSTGPEVPRSEPEIIPPGRDDGRPQASWSRVFIDEHGTHRIYFREVGPLGMVVGSLVVAGIAATMLLVMLGLLLIWIPLIGLIAASLLIAGWLRGYFARSR